MKNIKTLNQLYIEAKKNKVSNKNFTEFVRDLKMLFKKSFDKEADVEKEMFIDFANNFINNAIYVKNEMNFNEDGEKTENKEQTKKDDNETLNKKTSYFNKYFIKDNIILYTSLISLGINLYLLYNTLNKKNY